MSHSFSRHLIGLAALLASAAGGAQAQSDSYYYLGFGAGQSKVNIDEGRIAARLLSEGQTATTISHDERSTAYRVFGGYQFNRHLALEGGYFKLGRFGFRADTSSEGSLSGQFNVQGMNLDAVATLPITDNLSALARIGAQWARTRDDFSTTGGVVVADPSPSRRATNLKVGVGLQYALSSAVLLRGEAERYRINDATGERGGVNVWSVGLVFPFGRSEAARPYSAAAAPRQSAPAPAPMPAAAPMAAAEPVPAPVVVMQTPAAVPPQPQRQRVSYAAESLFGFDQSVVRSDGQAHLDTFARELSGARFDTISVEGHTDRLGTEAYNQTLSQSRADAVKAYLVSHGRIEEARIQAVGKGEGSPVTRAGDCVGNKPSARLVACLQPDRRVVIEVVGSR